MTEFQRQRDLLTPRMLEGLDVDIVGAGSLGGAILLCLCKMGCGIRNRMTITDFDQCERHNLPTQWFRTGHVELGLPKVEAIAEMAELVCEREVTTRHERFSGAEDRPLGPVVILAVDSIEERAGIWRNLRRRSDVDLLIDTRMGAEVCEIHAVAFRVDPLETYEESLHPPELTFQEPCTRRAIMYTALGTAAFVGSLFRAYAGGASFARYLLFDFRDFFLDRTDGGPARDDDPDAA